MILIFLVIFCLFKNVKEHEIIFHKELLEAIVQLSEQMKNGEWNLCTCGVTKTHCLF